MKNWMNTEDKKRKREERVVIDCAGAVKGGAARFLRELQKYLAEERPTNVELIGMGKQLTPQWLVQRELLAASATRRISLNNAGFLNPQGENITLLRNILQFATKDDLEALKFTLPRRLRAQIPVVRALAKASETLVVPCTRMAEQVARVTPGLASKLTIRFHPVSQPKWAGTLPENPYDVLLPIVPSPYKNLDQHIPEFLRASENIFNDAVRLIVPSRPEAFPELASHPRIMFIGPQTSEELDYWWKASGAIYFPTDFESFGYALAEGRVYGRGVIAQDTLQNREIAGEALHPYTRDKSETLRAAIVWALKATHSPEPAPFDPTRYFRWLFAGL